MSRRQIHHRQRSGDAWTRPCPSTVSFPPRSSIIFNSMDSTSTSSPEGLHYTDLRTHGPTDPRTYGPTDLRTHGPTDPRTDAPRDPRTHGPADPREHADPERRHPGK